jgi:hypothetical protein
MPGVGQLAVRSSTWQAKRGYQVGVLLFVGTSAELTPWISLVGHTAKRHLLFLLQHNDSYNPLEII